MPEQPGGGSQGPSTDRHNDPVVDPTANVRELVEAAIKRQDDLRDSEAQHMREIIELRADLGEKLRRAESERLDAIRAVDVGNVQRAAEVQSGVAAALEGKVAVTAAAFESRLTATIEPIQRRIDDLTRAQYEAQGQKTQVVETQAKGGSVVLWVGLAISGVLLLLTFVSVAITVLVLVLR